MNESFSLEFRRNGRTLPISRFSIRETQAWPPGITLDGEWSAWPLGLALNLAPRDQETRNAIKRVRERQQWRSNEFDLQVTSFSSRLELSGVAPDALPAGNYGLAVRLGTLKLARRSYVLKLESGKKPLVAVEEAPDKLRLVRTTSINDFDPRLKAIVSNSDSILDGQSATAWIDNPVVRDARRACLFNLLAKLAVLPTEADSLAGHVSHVIFADVDRIYVAAQPSLLSRLQGSTRFKRDSTVHPTHKRLLQRIVHAERDSYTLHSYREGPSPSMQIVVAEPPPGVADRTHYADVDIDMGNPSWDLKSLAIHIGELLSPDKTNHLKLYSKLNKDSLRHYLYYAVTKV